MSRKSAIDVIADGVETLRSKLDQVLLENLRLKQEIRMLHEELNKEKSIFTDMVPKFKEWLEQITGEEHP